MADDPLFGFTPVTPAAPAANDPLMGFKPSTPAGSGAAPSQSWSDYLHSAAMGLNTATRVATDAPTFGLMDKLFGQQAQADTAQAYQDVGNWAFPLGMAGSMVTGQGELAIGKGIGEATAPYLAKLPLTGAGKWLGGVLGSGAVGAGSGALGAYGHEAGWTPNMGDIETQGGIGLGLSMLFGGVPGGVVGRGGTLPTGVSASQLEATKDAAADAMGNVLYNNADLRQRTTQAISDIMAAPNRIAELGGGALGALNKFSLKILGAGARSAEDVNDLVRSLKQTSTGDKVPVAGQIAQDHFNDLLDTVQPVTSPNNIPLAPGAGRTAVNDFNQAFGRYQDLNRIVGPEGWEAKAAVAGGPDVGSQAKAYLLSDEGQRLAPPGSPQYDLYNNLAATAKPTQAPGAAPSAWDLRHVLQHAIEPGVMGLAFGGGEAAHGGSWGDILGAMAAGAGSGYLLHKGVPWVQSIGQQGRQQAALNAARIGTSLGQNVTPIAPLAALRSLIRNAIYGAGGAGVY